MPHAHLLTATRQSLDIILEVKEGSLPHDMHGYVFINSGVGSVNSNGLPYPPQKPDGSDNPEYGSPAINGDGYVFRFDLSEAGQIKLRTELLTPPAIMPITLPAHCAILPTIAFGIWPSKITAWRASPTNSAHATSSIPPLRPLSCPASSRAVF